MFDINQNVSVNELQVLNAQLRKNAADYQAQLAKASAPSSFGGSGAVGYQDAAVTAGAGALAPLVPQSIEQTLASATFTMNDLKLWPLLPKVSVSNTLHEYAVINEHGLDLDPFIQEGGGGSSTFGVSASSYERKSVKIKYMAERRQVSDVASLVGIIGANPNAIAEETERGTMSLLRKVESQLFHGNEDTNALGFDGIIKQIAHDPAGALRADGLRALSDNQDDLGGNGLNATTLHKYLGELSSAPRFGKPDFIMMEPRIYSKLIESSVGDGRHDSMMLVNYGDKGVQTFGAGPNIHIMGPQGPVPVISATFLHNQFAAPSAASSSSDQLPQIAAGAVTLTAQAETTAGDSQFVAGSYFYKFVFVNSHGYAAPFSPAAGAVAVALNDVVKFNFDTSKITNMTGGYVKVYRSDIDSPSTTCRLVSELSWTKILAGSYGGTADKGFDWGANKWGCGNVVIGEMNQNNIEFARLLDFLRRPLAETSAARNFLLMLFGSPIVKTPKKNFVLRNVLASQI